MKAEELKERLARGEKIDILDIREREEVEEDDLAIPGAVNMPMGKVFVEASKGKLPKDEKMVAVCRTGGRCEVVVRELKKKGYDVDYLEGGVQAWKELNA